MGPGNFIKDPISAISLRHGADVRHRRPAAHPDALLHRAQRQGGAQVGALGDHLDRLLLPADLHHRLRRHHAGAAPTRSSSTPRAALLGGGNMAAVHLANAVGGNVFLGFISAVAFATILAVVAGLTLSGASAVSHDLYATVFKKGKADSATSCACRASPRSRWASSRSCSASCSRSRTSPSWCRWPSRSRRRPTSRCCFMSVLWKDCTTRGAVDRRLPRAVLVGRC